MGGDPWDFSVSPSPFGLDFGTLDFGTSDSGLTIIYFFVINCSTGSQGYHKKLVTLSVFLFYVSVLTRIFLEHSI